VSGAPWPEERISAFLHEWNSGVADGDLVRRYGVKYPKERARFLRRRGYAVAFRRTFGMPLVRPATREDRFLSMVSPEPNSGCWIWIGSRPDVGYGCGFRIDGSVRERAHRLAYLIFVGPITDGLWVLHRCDQKWCCNPAHLFLGTVQDNSDDLVAKGLQVKGSRVKHAKLTESDVLEIRREVAAGTCQRRLAERFGVSPSSINVIVRRRRWRHVDVPTTAPIANSPERTRSVGNSQRAYPTKRRPTETVTTTGGLL
jgi:Autographiviridae endonuclease